MPTTIPAQYIGPFFRPEMHIDDSGHLILDAAGQAAAATYGLRFMYIGLPANTLYPPIAAALSNPSDTNSGANTIAEGASTNTPVGITAQATSNSGFPVTYSITADSSNGGFKVDPNTGVVTVANSSKIDFETSGASHAYTITVQANDGILTSTRTFTIGVSNVAPSTPIDGNAAANTVIEGAAANTLVGIQATSTDVNGPNVTWTLTNSANGAFKIDPVTGVVSVADPTKIDYEGSGPGHSYTITARASDGTATSSQTFTVGVSNVGPSTPTDGNAATNTVVEGAAANTLVGITATSTDVNGPGVTWSLTADSSNGGFKIDPNTGVVSVADPSKIDYETSGAGHSYIITARASDGTATSSQTFTIAVTDVGIGSPADTNAAANTVAEDAANGTTVGITASAVDPNGPATVYSLIGDTSNGGFTVNAATGIVTVADHTKIDFESAAGHSYSVTVQAVSGALTTSTVFTVAVTNVAPSTPADGNAAANTVVEGAANGSTVGLTVTSTDPNGPAVTYTLIGDSSNGGFTINATTGVVTVADSTKINFEPSGGSYTVTVQASDGTLTTSQTFAIAVSDVAPSTPVDTNAAANTVVEGAAIGTAAGITASSTDINGPGVIWSLAGDTSGGGFTIDATTGVITVADPTKIDFETSGGSYTVTAQASDGTLSSSQTFTIGVTNAAPSTPVDGNAAANSVAEGAANGSTVGVTASSTDVNGPGVTYSLIGDNSGGGFTINATTGVVTVADSTKIDFETLAFNGRDSYTITVQASDGTTTSTQTFAIAVTDIAPSTPVDSNAAANAVTEGAAAGTAVGITASATDVNGPGPGGLTYSLIGDSSNGGFTINAATGVITVANPSKIDFETSGGSYTVTAQASDGALSSSQTFTIAVTDVVPSTPVDTDAAADSVAEGAAAGTAVGITASSTDVNGPGVTYSLTGDSSNGGFTIDAATGVITVADPSKINYEDSSSHTVTVQASDGTLTSSQTFSIAINDVAPSAPVDSNSATNTVAEGAANGSTVGITASASDIVGGAVVYSLSNDSSNGGFAIDFTTGVITVADSSKIDFESSGGSYSVTVQSSDGTLSSSQIFTIAVTDVAPSTPVDRNAAANQVAQGAANGSTVGVTASSIDVNGPGVTYSLVGDTSNGGFTINAATGVVTVADSSKIIYNAGSPSYDITVDASDGTLHSQQTFTIGVILDNPPVVTAGNVLSYTENQAAAAIDPAVTVTDPDNADLTGATVQITGGYVNGEDILAFVDTANITGSFNAATGVLTLTGTDTVANYQAALASVTYFNNSDNPSGAARTVTFITNDGILDSTPVTSTINVTPVNDAPSVTASGNPNSTFTEGGAAVSVDSAIVLADVDSANLQSAFVGITGNWGGQTDLLTFDVSGTNITGSFDPNSGGLTFSGVDTVANYQAVLRSVKFQSTSENPSGAMRGIDISVRDTDNVQSNVGFRVVNVTPVNDAPATTAGGTLNYTENQAATAIDSTITVSDLDNANMSSATVQITGNYANGQDILGFTDQNGITGLFNAATGTLTLTGSSSVANYQTALRSITYSNSSENPSGLDRTVSYTVNDGTDNSNTSTATIHVTPVNDAPAVTAGAAGTFTENGAAANVAGSLTLSDADTATLNGATVTLTNAQSGDVLSVQGQGAATSGDLANGIHFEVDNGAHTVTFSNVDTVADYQAALQLVQFSNSSENPSTVARSFTVTADDGQAANNTGSASQSLTVVAVNDAPVNNGVPASQQTAYSDTAFEISGLSVTDVDAGAGSISTTLSVAHGTLAITLAPGASISAGANGSATVTITGTLAQVNATLANDVTYQSTSQYTGQETFTISTNDNGNTGIDPGLSGGAGNEADSDSFSIAVVPQVWFIDNTPGTVDAGAPLGSQNNPFTSIAAFNASAAPGPNDYIYLREGTYTENDGINLKDGQTLVGQGENLQFTNPFGGAPIVIETGSQGQTPVIVVTGNNNEGITLAQHNSIRGLDIGMNNATATGIEDGGGTVGNLTISNVGIGVGQNLGAAIDIDQGGQLNVQLDSIASAGASRAIDLGSTTGLSGTGNGFTVSGTTVIDDAGSGFEIHNSSLNATFTGKVTILNDAAGSGVGIDLTTNTGTYNFSGGVDTTVSNGFAFRAASSGTVNVVDVGNTQIVSNNGTAIIASSTTLTATIDQVTSTGGSEGISLNGMSGSLVMSSAIINGQTGDGIDITNSTGSLTILSGAIGNANDPGSIGVDINGGSGNVTIWAAVNKTTDGRVIEITDHTGTAGSGSLIQFRNTISATGDGDGIFLDNNDGTNGTTISFTQTLTLNTSASNSAGFTATNGGTVTATGSGSTINSGSGTALNITGTTIGAADVTFQSISANGASKAIVLNNTGSSGGLHVTGNGATDGSGDGTGGTIQNISVRGIELINTSDVQINNVNLTNANTTNGTSSDLDISASNAAIYMSGVTGASFNNININGTADNGITGLNVSNFSLANSTITQAGNAAHESGIEFSNLSGNSSISNTDISYSETNSLDIVNTDVNINLTVTGSTFRNTQTVSSGGADNANGEGGIQFRSFSTAAGAPTTNLTIDDNDFLNLRTQAIQIVGEDDSIVNVDITDNTIDALSDVAGTPNPADATHIGSGIDINGNDTAQVNFNIFRNTIDTRGGAAVNITSFLDAEVQGRIRSNVITAEAGVGAVGPNGNAGGSGVRVVAQETSHTIVEVKDNTITMGSLNNSSAIDAQARFQNARLDITLDNNTINSEASALADINITSGSSAAGETNQVYANIINNDVADDGPTNALRLRVSDLSNTNRLFLTGFVEGGAGIEDDAVATWNANGNTPVLTTATVTVSLTGTAVGPLAGTALTPTNPLPTTLTAASGGVQASSPTPGVTHLTQSQLDTIVSAAIAQWAQAGASSAQLAKLAALDFTVGDLAGNVIGDRIPGHVVIDTDAAGHGWFFDATPNDSFEFGNIANASGSHLFADPASAAAGHLDLLTAVVHEMGHELGLPDLTASADSNDLMYVNLVDGERRLPTSADVAETDGAQIFSYTSIGVTAPAQPDASAASAAAAAAANTIAVRPGSTVTGTAAADNFVFAVDFYRAAPATPAQVANYSFTDGDTFDFSALTTRFHASGIGDAQLVRAVADPGGQSATLKVNISDSGIDIASNWVSVARVGGVHSGDHIDVLVDSHNGVHHVDLLI